MGGYQTGEHGNTRFNCGFAALCHTISCSLGCNPAHAVGKTQPRAASPQNAQRRRIFGDPEAVLLTARIFFFREYFRGGCSNKQFRVPALWAEQIPLSLRARTFPHSYAALRNVGPDHPNTRKGKNARVGGPGSNARSLYALSEWQGLRVWVGTRQVSMGIHVFHREILLFSRRFSRGCSNKQFREPELWAEQIPLSLRARIFPHSYASLRNAGP